MALSDCWTDILTPSTKRGITSATALQLSISWSWVIWLVLYDPAPWLAAMHWVAVAAACFEAFSNLLIIFRFMVVLTAMCVVFLRYSAARFNASWLSRSVGLDAQDLAASTIRAVASASSLAAVKSLFWILKLSEKGNKEFVNTVKIPKLGLLSIRTRLW